MRGTPIISNDRWWGTSWGLPWSNMLCWLFQGHSKFIPPSSTKGIWTLVAIETIPMLCWWWNQRESKRTHSLVTLFSSKYHHQVALLTPPMQGAKKSCTEIHVRQNWGAFCVKLKSTTSENQWSQTLNPLNIYIPSLKTNQNSPEKIDHPGNTCSIVFHVDIKKSTGPPDMYKPHVSNGIYDMIYFHIYIYLYHINRLAGFLSINNLETASSAPSRPNRSRQTPGERWCQRGVEWFLVWWSWSKVMEYIIKYVHSCIVHKKLQQQRQQQLQQQQQREFG